MVTKKWKIFKGNIYENTSEEANVTKKFRFRKWYVLNLKETGEKNIYIYFDIEKKLV